MSNSGRLYFFPQCYKYWWVRKIRIINGVTVDRLVRREESIKNIGILIKFWNIILNIDIGQRQ